MRTNAIDAAVAAIDLDAITTTLGELVAIPSLSTDETPAQDYVAAWLADAGLAVEQWDFRPDDLAWSPWYSTEFDRDLARGVVARYGAGAGPTLLLSGHVDVVPPGRPADWSSPPFEPSVRDGRLYGRGACDMKGGLAAQLHAVAAIVRAGIELDGEVLVAPVIGEEDGGCGTLALLEHGITADAAIISEPTRLAVVPAVAGALSFEIEVRGVSAHGCLREEGVSAIEHMMPVQRALVGLEQTRNQRRAEDLFAWLDRPFAICAGRIEGGDWPSSEADWCRISGRYGVAPGEDLHAARAEFEAAVAEAAHDDAWLGEHPPTVRWHGGQFHPARTDLDDPIVTALTSAHRAETGAYELRGMPYGCDMGITVGRGSIPTLVYGPGDIRDAHAPDEHVRLDDVVTCARALVRTIVERCADNGS